jgi:hypothetical protein
MRTITFKLPDIPNIIRNSHWSIKLLLVTLGLIYAPVLLVAVLAAYGGYQLAKKRETPTIVPYENAKNA